MKQGKHQIHGRNEFSKKRTLDQVLGYTGTDKYDTMDKNVYIEQINGMNKSDLNRHAISKGLVPVDSRELLEKRLLREFESHVASFEEVEKPQVKSTNKSLNKLALDIMSAGR